MRAVCLFVAVLLAAGAANAAGQSISKQVAADPNGEVDITNVAGSIQVTAWDRPMVDVQGFIGSGIERVDVLTEGSHTIVRVVLPRTSRHDGEAKLQIRVPAANDIELNSVSSDYIGIGLAGAQRLKTVSGDVRTDVAAADIEIKTVSGDVRLKGKGQAANLRVQTVSGDVIVEKGAGTLEVVTVSGDLRAQVDPAKSLRLRTTSGNVQVSGKLAAGISVDAESVSGNVRVEGPVENGYQYDVSSFSGDIRSCFTSPAERTGKFGLGSALNGTLGAGGGRVRVKTMSGNITLCDKV
jgi:DUF4097 and DUF4098 domain-containing protein YvlB